MVFIWKKYKVISLLFTFIIIISISTLSFYRKALKENLNDEIIYQVNSNSFLTSEFTQEEETVTILTPKTISVETSIDSSFEVSIKEINNGKFAKKIIEHETYYEYSFEASLVLIKNNVEYLKNIHSSVIVEKVRQIYNLKSTDDLKQEISKEIMEIKSSNSEDISKELNDISLLYQNDALNIQLSYPNYYTYTTNLIYNSNDDIENTVSFYMDDDKKSNYMLVSFHSNYELTPEDIVDEFLEKNYSLSKDAFITTQNLEFSVLTQQFNQDKDITEIVFVSKSSYKSIDQILITVKVNSTLLSSKQSELEEMIKSIK